MENSYQNSTTAQIIDAIINQLSFEGESKSDIADILLSILNQTPYEKEPSSVIAELFIKLKAKIEGESFEPFDKPYISNIADIIKSILDETEYNNAPNSRIAELLLELKEQIEEDFTELTASGSIASFETNVSKPIVNLTAYVKATQEAGTPTRQNPKAISGVSELSIKHSGSDMTDYDEYIVNLGGTYYGGELSQDKNGGRKFKITHREKIKIKDLGYWNYSESGNRFYINNIADVLQKTDWNKHIGLCECYVEGRVGNNSGDDFAFGFYNASLYLRDSNFNDVQSWLAVVGDYYITYELAEPYEIDLPDGTPISSFIGVNNIYNDSGDSEVTYLYKGEPETSNVLSSNNFGGLLGMDTENDNQEE